MSLDGGWIAAIVLAIMLVFRDTLKTHLSKAISAVIDRAYRRLAGSRILRRRAIAKYRKGLVEAKERIQVPFRPLDRPLVLKDIYVPLRATAAGGESPRDVLAFLDEHRRLVVTGPPGAGKSMLMRNLAARSGAGLRDGATRGRLPVLVELHRVGRPASNGGEAIEDYLVDAFERYGFPHAEKFTRIAIEKGWLLLLLDGFDEVPTADRKAVAGRIVDFLERERSCAAAITSRTAVYRGEFDAIAEARVELEPFEDQQIQAFLGSWKDSMPEGKSPAQLMAALRDQPQLLAAARNPLLLTIVAHLYSESRSYTLPASRAEFYKHAASILLEQWQGQQNTFDGSDKRAVLSALALHMQETGTDSDLDRRTIAREQAISRATELMPSLGRTAADVGELMREIVERSGLLLAIDDGSRYAFAHLTFQEYFAAEALLNRSEDLLAGLREDADTWREVAILWCGLVADSTAMIEDIEAIDADVALACVAEARAVDERVAGRILDPVIARVVSGEADEDLQRSLGSVAADIRPRGTEVLKGLVRALDEAESTGRCLSIATALAASNRSAASRAIVEHLEDEPELSASVVRLGDLAVPHLERVARDGRSPLPCACLASIGTPEAGLALAKTMTGGGPLETPAAWGLAHVVANPLVAERLERMPKPRLGPEQAAGFAWIWKPFAPPGSTLVPLLVGLAADLILSTRDLDLAIASPDPRISVALCTMDHNNRLDSPIEPTPAFRALVDEVTERDRTTQYVVTEGGRLEIKPSTASFAFRARTSKARTYGDLLNTVYYGVVSTDRRSASSPLSGGEPQTIEAALTANLDPVIDGILRIFESDQVWVHLLRGMPRIVRREALVRSTGRGKVNSETWPAVRQISPYSFAGSRWYGGVLILALLMSLVALCETASIIWQDFGTVEGTLALLCGACIAATWIWLRTESRSSPLSRGGIRTYYFGEAVFGFIAAPLEIIDDRDSPSLLARDLRQLPTALFLPGGCWLVGSAIASRTSSTAAILAVAGLIVCGVGLWVYGSARERRLTMPLSGFFLDGQATLGSEALAFA